MAAFDQSLLKTASSLFHDRCTQTVTAIPSIPPLPEPHLQAE
jgi:hypothetical protein